MADAGLKDTETLAAVGAQMPAALSVMRFVHGHPELAHEEHACSAHIADTLAAGGYRVERGVGGMPTAFRATFEGARPGRAVGMIVLYDAVAAVRPMPVSEAVPVPALVLPAAQVVGVWSTPL